MGEKKKTENGWQTKKTTNLKKCIWTSPLSFFLRNKERKRERKKKGEGEELSFVLSYNCILTARFSKPLLSEEGVGVTARWASHLHLHLVSHLPHSPPWHTLSPPRALHPSNKTLGTFCLTLEFNISPPPRHPQFSAHSFFLLVYSLLSPSPSFRLCLVSFLLHTLFNFHSFSTLFSLTPRLLSLNLWFFICPSLLFFLSHFSSNCFVHSLSLV